jgi:predicted dehydrogenase
MCVAVADAVPEKARELARRVGADVMDDWRGLVDRRDLDAVVVATPTGFLAEVTIAALEAGLHVLVEKPMGRNLHEALEMSASAGRARRTLKVGFNHRYHSAIAEAYRRFARGEIGALLNIRARYGHGGRPGMEKEWRADRSLAGGGELTDQGIHLIDLIHWFAGPPWAGTAYLQVAMGRLGDLEDNAFGMVRCDRDVVASFHVSCTQWKNLFSFEVFGELGALLAEGLGGSYGTERLTTYRRRLEGGAPLAEEEQFDGPDMSWAREWEEFVGAVQDGRAMMGTVEDGVAAMRTLDLLYRSAAHGRSHEVQGYAVI